MAWCLCLGSRIDNGVTTVVSGAEAAKVGYWFSLSVTGVNLGSLALMASARVVSVLRIRVRVVRCGFIRRLRRVLLLGVLFLLCSGLGLSIWVCLCLMLCVWCLVWRCRRCRLGLRIDGFVVCWMRSVRCGVWRCVWVRRLVRLLLVVWRRSNLVLSGLWLVMLCLLLVRILLWL